MPHTAEHTTFYNNVKNEFHNLSKCEVLRKCFQNYRDGRGMRLRYKVFCYCKQHKLYQFYKIPLTEKFDSRHISLLDKLTKTPFCITKKNAYISDKDIVFDVTISGDDFDVFLEIHR
ncbi:hypothetical protein NVP2275O_391 [Vibrio phage 2.275.O._10N.286.54.E11]|nr:hypothetical protein NVP2275O_391 [Vibrio phage 2.275.O._10N.286.54.E11]